MTVSNARPWFWVDSYAHAVYFQSAIERHSGTTDPHPVSVSIPRRWHLTVARNSRQLGSRLLRCAGASQRKTSFRRPGFSASRRHHLNCDKAPAAPMQVIYLALYQSQQDSVSFSPPLVSRDFRRDAALLVLDHDKIAPPRLSSRTVARCPLDAHYWTDATHRGLGDPVIPTVCLSRIPSTSASKPSQQHVHFSVAPAAEQGMAVANPIRIWDAVS